MAQKPSREYLVRFADENFPASLRAAGITPLHHAGQVWAVRTSDEKALRQTTEIQEFVPAVSVIIQLRSDSPGMTTAIRNAGGIVVRSFRNVQAVSAILPMARVGEIQRLPDVRRVIKEHPLLPLQSPSE